MYLDIILVLRRTLAMDIYMYALGLKNSLLLLFIWIEATCKLWCQPQNFFL